MAAIMDNAAIETIIDRFVSLTAMVPLHRIRSEHGYTQALAVMNRLLDAGGADEHSPLADLINALATFIADYEDRVYPPQAIAPVDSLRFLMKQHQLTQADLPEIGSQGVVSEILRGKRALNVRQIKALSERFQVPATVFL